MTRKTRFQTDIRTIRSKQNTSHKQ